MCKDATKCVLFVNGCYNSVSYTHLQGVWNGKQILPEGWVRKVERTAIPTDRGDGEYSLLFWKSRNDTYSAVGKFGQYCTICPEKDAVIVINALDKDDPNLLDVYKRQILSNS